MTQQSPRQSDEYWEDAVENRLKRMETKLSQLMLHLGMTPQTPMYVKDPNPHAQKLFGVSVNGSGAGPKQ